MPKKHSNPPDTTTEETQKIIIPRGTVDPNNDTVIEIPVALKNQPVVLARPDVWEKEKYSRTENAPPTRSYSYTESKKAAVKEKSMDDYFKDKQYANISCSKERNCSNLSKSYQTEPPSNSYSANKSSFEAEISAELEETELKEKTILEKQLKEFQNARRQFLLDTADITNVSGKKKVMEISCSVCPSKTVKPKYTESSVQVEQLFDTGSKSYSMASTKVESSNLTIAQSDKPKSKKSRWKRSSKNKESSKEDHVQEDKENDLKDENKKDMSNNDLNHSNSKKKRRHISSEGTQDSDDATREMSFDKVSLPRSDLDPNKKRGKNVSASDIQSDDFSTSTKEDTKTQSCTDNCSSRIKKERALDQDTDFFDKFTQSILNKKKSCGGNCQSEKHFPIHSSTYIDETKQSIKKIISPSLSPINVKDSKFTKQCLEELKKPYFNYLERDDDIYLEELKRQFEETKKKLDEAVALASLTFKKSKDIFNSRSCTTKSICEDKPIKESKSCCSKPTCNKSFRKKSCCDSVEYELPEKDSQEGKNSSEHLQKKAKELEKLVQQLFAEPCRKNTSAELVKEVKSCCSKPTCNKTSEKRTCCKKPSDTYKQDTNVSVKGCEEGKSCADNLKDKAKDLENLVQKLFADSSGKNATVKVTTTQIKRNDNGTQTTFLRKKYDTKNRTYRSIMAEVKQDQTGSICPITLNSSKAINVVKPPKDFLDADDLSLDEQDGEFILK